MRSYRPEELFDDDGRLVAGAGALAPAGDAPDGREPPRQRRSAPRRVSTCPTSRDYAVDVVAAGRDERRSPRARSGELLRDMFTPQRSGRELPPVLSRRDQLEPARRRVRGGEPLLARTRRPTSTTTCRRRRSRHGGAQRAPLRGLAGGLPPHRPPRPVRHLRGVRHGVGVDDRAARQVARGGRASSTGGGRWRR